MDKAELNQYRDLKLELNQIIRMLSQMNGDIYSISSPSLSGMPHGNNTVSGSPQEKKADKTMEMRDLYERKILELKRQMLRIENALDCLQPRERFIMRMHYIEGITWDEMPEMCPFSRRHILRLHGYALKELRKFK